MVGLFLFSALAQAANPVTNQELIYTFQGLSEDGAYFIAAVLPVAYPDLPANVEAASADFADDYEAYLAGVVEMLNQADPASFTPNLTALDEMMTSMTVVGTMGTGENGTAVHTEADLVFRLEEAGAEVALNTEPVPAADILAVPGHIINVNGEQLQLFVYADTAAATADADRISADGYEN
jgi:hypothetical protein